MWVAPVVENTLLESDIWKRNMIQSKIGLTLSLFPRALAQARLKIRTVILKPAIVWRMIKTTNKYRKHPLFFLTQFWKGSQPITYHGPDCSYIFLKAIKTVRVVGMVAKRETADSRSKSYLRHQKATTLSGDSRHRQYK